MGTPLIEKPRKWHFLLLGSTLILISAFLWYWDWRILGIPSPLRAEHFITILIFILGVFVLGVFIYRLNHRQVTIMLVGMILINLVATLSTVWIIRTYPSFFVLLHPTGIDSFDPAYALRCRDCFATPALYATHIALMLLWVESLIVFFVRKPTVDPE